MAKNQLDRSQDSHTYHYDSAQRFTKMERGTIGGTPSFYQGYTLDALANWSSFNNNGTTESRSHDVMNAITARGATSLSHDLNGNLTNDGNQKYIWDELNRLVEVRDSGNTIICDYYYNADNLRVEKHYAGGAKEQIYYDGAIAIEETDGSQNLVREYVNGGQYIDEVILVANTVGASITYSYYMTDLRFSVYGFLDSSGAVVERAKYDGYGKRTLTDPSYSTITTPVVDQSYGYTGIRHDTETGLQYYRARYFDNDLGRFINRDPIGYHDGLNLYRGYFISNHLDPSGNKTITLNFGFENGLDPKNKKLLSNIDAGVKKLKADLKYCCDKWKLNCETKVKTNFDENTNDKMPPNDNDYGSDNTKDKELMRDNLGKIKGEDGGVPILVTNSTLSFAGGVNYAKNGKQIGIALSSPKNSENPFRFNENTISHELGHRAGYDCGTIDNATHVIDNENVMSQATEAPASTKPDKCWCEKIGGLAK